MRRLQGFIFSAAAILASGTALVPPTPARAAVSFNINFGFNYFHDRLGDQGRWLYSPIWGDVWQPRRRLVGYDFQPYTNGYWEYTDEYGWYWVSEDSFDDVVYHYGRWVYDPDLTWVWIPGYTWSPGWVVWREGGGYSGWMPMPPDEAFISGTGLSLGMNFGSVGFNFYGYDRWYGNRVDPGRFWVVVDNRNLANRDYRRYVVPRDRARVIINNTRNVTKFEVVNNRVVNRSIDVNVIERASGRRIAPVPAREVIKPNAIVTTVDESNHIRERERAQHPIRADFVRGGGMGGANGGAAGGATGGKPGPGPGPGGATGRPGGAMNGPANEQPNGAEGNRRERNNAGGNGGAMNGGADQQNGAAEGSKRNRSDESGGATTGGAGEQSGTQEGGKRNRDSGSAGAGGSAATSGTGAGGEQKAGEENATRKPRNLSNGSPDSNAASGESNGTSGRTNRRGSNATTTGPEGGQPTGTSANGNGSSDAATRRNNSNPGTDNGMQGTAPNGTPSGERANRTPRTSNPGAMTGPSDNSASPPAEQRHRGTNPNGGSSGSQPTSASNGQQPDNSGNEQKKKKHNPPGTPPDSGTPQ
jgi:hypothetical protein